MNKSHTRARSIGHALRVLLCYVVVLQAFLAAYSAAFAAGQTGAGGSSTLTLAKPGGISTQMLLIIGAAVVGLVLFLTMSKRR